jgi:hypothetical protein
MGVRASLVGLLLLPVAWGCPQEDGLSAFTRQAEVDRTAVEIGPTDPGIPATGTVSLRNRGEQTVHARLEVTPRDAPFFLDTTNVTADTTWQDIPVRLMAFEAGTYDATLTLHTNSTDLSVIQVSLRGVVRAPPNCEDHNPCTLDLVDGRSCRHVAVSGPCDDGNLCTVQDQCVDGQCGGKPRECGDGVACTVDSCDPAVGCLNTPRNESCDDGQPCTADLCVPGLGCTNAVAPNGTLCGLPSCEALPLCVSGECRAMQAPDGFPCEDGNPCTLGDHCVAGRCEKGVGEDIGVGDPVVVGTGVPGPLGVVVEPVDLGGIAPLGDGVVRVAWRSAPVGGAACPDGSCDPVSDPSTCDDTLRQTHGGFAAHVTDVTSEGETRLHVELAPPRTDLAAVALRAAPSSQGLVVVVLFNTRPACCPAGHACEQQTLTTVAALYRVRDDGTVEGPVVVSEQDATHAWGIPYHLLPVAVAAEQDSVVVLTSRFLSPACLGACPDNVIFTLWRVDLGQHPPALGGSNDVIPPPVATGAQAVAGLADVTLAIRGDDLRLVWRSSANPGPSALAACGPVDGATWHGHGWKGSVSHADQPGEMTEISSSLGSVAGISVAPGLVRPVLFTLDRAVLPVSTNCNDDQVCACTVHDVVTGVDGSARTVLLDQSDPEGASAVVRLGSGSAFGRAVGVAMMADGAAQVVSPPVGITPEISVRFTPPEGVPVRMLPDTVPALEEDGATAWLAGLFRVDLGLLGSLKAVAMVQAGCGMRPTGQIKGLTPPDAGVATDAGGAGDAGDAGPGEPGDAGDLTDAAAPDDAGEDGGPTVMTQPYAPDAGVPDGG